MGAEHLGVIFDIRCQGGCLVTHYSTSTATPGDKEEADNVDGGGDDDDAHNNTVILMVVIFFLLIAIISQYELIINTSIINDDHIEFSLQQLTQQPSTSSTFFFAGLIYTV